MSKEEIDKIASDYLNDCESESDMLDVFAIAKDALEQLDKIRAEIKELRFGLPLRKFVVDECLEIIDKYRESER